MTPAIVRQHKSIPDGNISNGGGLIHIIQTGSYGRPKGHINCLRVQAQHSPTWNAAKFQILMADADPCR